MLLQQPLGAMQTPKPVELAVNVKTATIRKSSDSACMQRLKSVLDELVDIQLSLNCTAGQGFLCNAEGNIRVYLAQYDQTTST